MFIQTYFHKHAYEMRRQNSANECIIVICIYICGALLTICYNKLTVVSQTEHTYTHTRVQYLDQLAIWRSNEQHFGCSVNRAHILTHT